MHRVRHAACVATGHMGAAANSIAMDVLRVLDAGKVQRTAAARALVRLAPAGQQILLDLLCNARCQTRGGVKTRAAAALALGHTPEASPLTDATVRVLFDSCADPKPEVRSSALLSLGQLAGVTEERVTYLRSRSLLPFVYQHLRDRDAVVRKSAAEVLARAAPRGEMLLIEGLLQDKEERVRVAIAHGLRTVGAQSVRTLLLALQDQSAKVRAAVADAILSFGVNEIARELASRSEGNRQSVVHELKALLESHVVYSPKLDQMLLVLVGRLSGFTMYSERKSR